MSSESDKLEKRISSADDAIGRALEERARAYRELHAESAGRLVDTREVAALLKSRAPSLRSESLDALARELESACQAAARPPQIAIAGEAGSIVHRVARGFFGAAATFVTVADTESVFDALARSRCDYGVVPFESTTDGAFVSALVGLTESNARIAGEIWTPAGYQLASVTGNAGDVEKVYSTAAAHAACRSFLRSRFSSASVIEVDSVASGVVLAADEHGAAVIVSDPALHAQPLRVIEKSIEDDARVETRYALLSRDPAPRTGRDRTILVLALKDEPGALHAALKPFADRGVNITRVRSEVSRDGAWRYVFVLELDGHVTDRSVVTAVEETRAATRWTKVLGSFPRPARES